MLKIFRQIIAAIRYVLETDPGRPESSSRVFTALLMAVYLMGAADAVVRVWPWIIEDKFAFYITYAIPFNALWIAIYITFKGRGIFSGERSEPFSLSQRFAQTISKKASLSSNLLLLTGVVCIWHLKNRRAAALLLIGALVLRAYFVYLVLQSKFRIVRYECLRSDGDYYVSPEKY